MDFQRVEKDDKEDWLNHPVTDAFMNHVMRERANCVLWLVDTIKTGDEISLPRLQHIGGRLAAVDELLGLLERRLSNGS